MSCPNATAPVNVSRAKVKGKCDYKCAYSFQYPSSFSGVVTHRDHYLSVKPTAGGSSSSSSAPSFPTGADATYNATPFALRELRLHAPSLHAYNGARAAAELILLHESASGAPPLLVCLPVRATGSGGASTPWLQAVIEAVAASAPGEDESATLPALGSVSGLVPVRTPFFSYSATEPWQPCATEVDLIVFAPCLDLSSGALQTLTNLIQPHAYALVEGPTAPSVFLNAQGANTAGGAGTEGLYIDCQPVGASDETTDALVSSSSSLSSSSSSSLLSWAGGGKGLRSAPAQLLLVLGLCLLLLFGLRFGLQHLTSGAKTSVQSGLGSLPSLPSIFSSKRGASG